MHSVFCMHLCRIYSVAGERFHAAEEKDRIVVQAVGGDVQRDRRAGIFTVDAQSFDKLVATIDHSVSLTGCSLHHLENAGDF